MAEWQRARLIPVSGIGSEIEAEMRATSALLAVIEAVRDLSIEMLSPLGASKAQKAEVRSYTEVPFKLGGGKTATRPDGLIQVAYGKATWTALVEVKTGDATLNADQVNGYWDIARDQDFDAVITISNEIAASKDTHPTDGLKVRSNSKVKVHHFSWTAIQSMCEVIKNHHGVDDPDRPGSPASSSGIYATRTRAPTRSTTWAENGWPFEMAPETRRFERTTLPFVTWLSAGTSCFATPRFVSKLTSASP